MRSLALIAALFLAGLSLASPAAAQIRPNPNLAPDPGALALQEMQRQQLVQQQNQITSLEAQLRTEQAIASVQAMRVSPRLTPPDTDGPAPPAQIDTSQLASIPDATLADSNRKVLEAAGRH